MSEFYLLLKPEEEKQLGNIFIFSHEQGEN